ncbi:hypothetical protein [Rothia nasimurium]|uniref:hypothetical protein n=1 Tax=Rothia nasimurium TaxID=85336 RepID=UPI002DD67FAB|nr:hypothetical protein [Rothia nasimurium]
MSATITPIHQARERAMSVHPSMGTSKPAPFSLQTGGAGLDKTPDLGAQHRLERFKPVASLKPTTGTGSSVEGSFSALEGELAAVEKDLRAAQFDQITAAPGSVDDVEAAALVGYLRSRRGQLLAEVKAGREAHRQPVAGSVPVPAAPAAGSVGSQVAAHLGCAVTLAGQGAAASVLQVAGVVAEAVRVPSPVSVARLWVAAAGASGAQGQGAAAPSVGSRRRGPRPVHVSRPGVPVPRPVPRRHSVRSVLAPVSALAPFKPAPATVFAGGEAA